MTLARQELPGVVDLTTLKSRGTAESKVRYAYQPSLWDLDIG